MRPADSSERVLTPEAPALGPSRRLALCLRSRPGRAGRWGGGRRVGKGPLHPRGRDPCGLLGNRSAVAWDPAHTPRHHPAVHFRRKHAGPRDTHTGAGQGRARGPNRVREEDTREASVPQEPTASRRPGRPCPASATPSSSRTSLGPKVWAPGQGALGVWAPGWGLQESGLRGGRSGGLPTRPRTGVGVCPRKLLKTLTGREHAVQPPPPALSPLNTHPPPAHAPANRNLHHLPAL